MNSADVAKRCGMSIAQFYRHRAKMHARDGMPQPISSVGRPAWERSGMEAWLNRHHPLRTPPAANDAGERPAPASEEDWRRHLHDVYASAG
jgi:predicted DNA-binding transcriptional regulator AlpA